MKKTYRGKGIVVSAMVLTGRIPLKNPESRNTGLFGGRTKDNQRPLMESNFQEAAKVKGKNKLRLVRDKPEPGEEKVHGGKDFGLVFYGLVNPAHPNPLIKMAGEKKKNE